MKKIHYYSELFTSLLNYRHPRYGDTGARVWITDAYGVAPRTLHPRAGQALTVTASTLASGYAAMYVSRECAWPSLFFLRRLPTQSSKFYKEAQKY